MSGRGSGGGGRGGLHVRVKTAKKRSVSSTRWLQPCTLSSDPILRRRSIEIIQFLSRQAADNRFLGFCLTQGEELDVEEGALLLAQTQYPEINTLAYQALFDSYAADLREQINPAAPAVEPLS